ncbi:MAG: hypothetical protein OXL34_06155 [Gemmatimonadota bacterium]|nr:hypothetical protein [Gemmatimonadota bacterium]
MAISLEDDAVHALNRAAAAAARECSEAIAPRDILAGVISQADPTLLEILSHLELDPGTLPHKLRNLPETYDGHLPFTSAAHEVLAAAVEAASAAEPGGTRSAHLLLGVARAGGPRSSAVLNDWGLNSNALATALAPQRAPEAAANHDTVQAASGTATALLIAATLSLACAPDPGADPPPPPPDPFAATPADGPVPDIGPAPTDYRPTAAGAPSTDIWIGRIERVAGGALQIRDLVNATDRDGYDNQPAFDPSGTAVYYTSAVDSTQTETSRYLLEDGAAEQVTHTPGASEFSPTPIPAQDAFSAIREERGRQFLWRYGSDGSDLGPIFATVEPVGYHAWANGTVAAMFVLGDPPTLQVGDALSGEVRTVAENPGRSIHRIPGSGDVSFVRKVADEDWWIERLDPVTGETTRLVATPSGREDYAWTPEGEILIGDGARLLVWSGEAEWREAAHLDEADGGDISRIAVSADGTRIALVRNRQ